MRSKMLGLAAGSLLVAGCAGSAVDVLTKADPAYDFEHHRSYKWESAELSDRLPPSAVDPAELDARIRAAVDAGLQERGYRPSETPDLLVTYQVQASNRVRASSDPPPASWDPAMDITKYASAALILDFTETKNNDRVWRGAAITDVQQGEGRKRVQDVVDKVLRDFPPKR